jgi:hypothetical protein
MPPFSSISPAGANIPSVHSRVLALPFGIPAALTAGIPSNRFVFWNTEARNTNGETLTDNITVSYAGAANATVQPAGVVRDGCSDGYSDLIFLPGSNRDFNVTVTLLGTAIVQVAPGAIIPQGSLAFSDVNGLAAATGTATGFHVLRGATGVGTATSPEFIVVLVR